MTRKIGMGGGCHWCTEAVFQSLKGVTLVEQGYISSSGEAAGPSEGVIITYHPEKISLKTLIEIHLLTHEATSNHSFRKKYRSAVYFLIAEDAPLSRGILKTLQTKFKNPLITQVLPCIKFESSRESLKDYYFSDPQKPFCQRYIDPKIQTLLKHHGQEVDLTKFKFSDR